MGTEKEQLEEFERIYDDIDDHLDEIDAELAEFIDRHPTFAEEFAMYDESPDYPEPSPRSDRLDDLDGTNPIQSEWACVLKYGYRLALVDTLGKMSIRTDLGGSDRD